MSLFLCVKEADVILFYVETGLHFDAFLCLFNSPHPHIGLH